MSAYFTCKYGFVYDPNGHLFVGRGVSIPDYQLSTWVSNAACQPLTTLFPSVNCVRLDSYSYWAASTYATQIGYLTAKNIVVVIENHQNFNANGSSAGNAGGGAGVIFTSGNGLLSPESTWYANNATYYLTNPYVWFGTNNEPSSTSSSGNADLAALTAWQNATYQAIRGTGSNTIVEIEQSEPYWQGKWGVLGNFPGQTPLTTLTLATYNAMSSVVMGPHSYAWLWNGTTVDPGESVILNSAVGSTNSPYGGIVQQIENLQYITTEDGLVPCAICEFGPSTNGSALDPGGYSCVDAVLAATDDHTCFMYLSWWIVSGTPAQNSLTTNTTTLTAYGDIVAADVLNNMIGCTPSPNNSIIYAQTPDGTMVGIANTLVYASSTPGSPGAQNAIAFAGGQILVDGVAISGTSGASALYVIDQSVFWLGSSSWHGPIVSGNAGSSGLASPVPTVVLSNMTFPPDSPSGTTVGNLSVTTGLANGTIGTGAYTWTYALSGTDAAKFQIVSGVLQTAVANLAGSYSIVISATPNTTILGSPFPMSFMPSAVPAQASAVGYNTLTFGPQITVSTTVDPTTSYPAFTTGVNWAPYNFGGAEWTTVQFTQNADGSVSMNGTGQSYGNGLATAVSGNPNLTTNRLEFTGIAFGGGGYFEANMAFNGPSAFWANDLETQNGVQVNAGPNPWPGQAAGYGDWIENDIAEFDTTGVYGFAIHNWYADVGSGDDVNTGAVSGSPASPPGAIYTNPNRYGLLWVPATGSSQGYAKWYFNDTQVGNTVTWDQYNSSNGPPPVVGTTAFSVMDTLHHYLILGCNPGTNLTVYSVSVWQASNSGNLVGTGP